MLRKRLGRPKSGEKLETKSSVSPYTSFVLSPLPAWEGRKLLRCLGYNLLLPNATFSSFTYFNVFSLRNSLMYNICKWKVLCFGSPLAQRRLTLLMKTVRHVRKLTFCLNIADLVTIIILFNLTSKVKRHNHTLPIFPSRKKK